ncbi:MAG TPA: MarR family transcriptional regulator [Pseudonocardiaceae bacterium]|nr:MarR family transcriptional regulator [Pseudonocardiaceae bacterium]
MTEADQLPDRVQRAAPSDAQQLTDVVTRLRRALRTSIRTDYPWESLPMAQVELLMALADHAPAKIGHLARLQRLAPNTVSGLVQQLVEAGLASRETDPSDRRVARVTLTEAGHRQLDEWRAAHERRIGSALDRLPPGDREAIMAALPGLDLLVRRLTKPAEPEEDATGGK